jgi:DNA polymerase I-like protein with 3'-5' exonuclease and polymerase domains
MSRFKNKKLIIDTPELLEQLLDYYRDSKFKTLAYDVETNGLHTYKSTIIGFSISPSETEGFYIPLLTWEKDIKSLKKRKKGGVEYEVCSQGQLRCVWTKKTFPEFTSPKLYQPPEFIKELLKEITKDAKLIMHNAVFDCAMTWQNYEIDLSEQLHCDTRLLKHYLDESTPTGLKETATLWSKELGFDAQEEAKAEQVEMKTSVISNGGKSGQVWRGDLGVVGKYAIQDVCLTMGLYRVGSFKLKKEYGQKGIDLFYTHEIMPLCKEVVIPMRIGGVFTDVAHFEHIKKELIKTIEKYEDIAMSKITPQLEGFKIGKSLDSVSPKAVIERIIDLEGLEYPQHTVKGEVKNSLAKKAVKASYEKEPHWLWGYILGFDELKYSEEKLKEIKEELYRTKVKRRYQFNINSDQHLRWLLFDKLGNDKKSVPQTDSATPDNPIPSCKAEVLEQHFKARYDFIEYVMLYRRLGDLLSNYVEKAVTLHHNGYLSMDFDQAGTTSGRFAVRGGFNLQTLPKLENLNSCPKCESKEVEIKHENALLADLKCKKCGHKVNHIIKYSVVKQGFIAPKGMKIVYSDFSSLEPRVFSEVSNDDKLKEIFIKDLDFYSKIYCDVEDTEGRYSPDPKAPNFLKKVNPDLRQSIKGVILSIPYGALGPQVASLLGFRKKLKISKTKEVEVLDVKRGQDWREKYLNAYPELRKYMDKSELDASTKGWVETRMGRRRHFKYAPIIQKILNFRRASGEDFVNLKRSLLENEYVDLGDGLSAQDLEWFARASGIYMTKIKEKGYWRYIKALYKNDLDAAKNMPIQGLAGHICNRAMLDTTRAYKKANVQGYIGLMVHDSIASYVPKEQAQSKPQNYYK